MKHIILVLSGLTINSALFSQKIILQDSFSNNEKSWIIEANDREVFGFDGGKYFIQGFTDSTITSTIISPLNNSRSYTISTTATHIGGVNNYGFGITIRNKNLNSSYNFVISPIGYYKFYGYDNGKYKQFADWTAHSAIRKGSKMENFITITKEEANWKLYINDQFIGTIPVQFPIATTSMGFTVSNKQRVEFDDLLVIEQ